MYRIPLKERSETQMSSKIVLVEIHLATLLCCRKIFVSNCRHEKEKEREKENERK